MKAALRRAALRALVLVVVSAAAALVVVCLTRLPSVATVVALCLLILAGSALSAPHGSLNVTLAGFVISSVYVIAGPSTAIVIAAVGAVLLLRRPVPWAKRVFSIATRVLSAAGGAVAYVALDGPVGPEVFDHIARALIAITATGLANQLVNASLMCAYMWLERGAEPVLEIGRAHV